MDTPPTPTFAHGGAAATVTAVAFTHHGSGGGAARGVLVGTARGGLAWHDGGREEGVARPSTARLEGHEDAAVLAVDAVASVAVSAGADGVVRTFRVSDGRPSRASTTVRAHVGPVRGACLVQPVGGGGGDGWPASSPPSRLLTFSDAAAAKLWTVDAAAPAPRPAFTASLLRGHAHWVRSADAVAGGAAGELAAVTGGADGRAVFWSLDAVPRPAAAVTLAVRQAGADASVAALRFCGGGGPLLAAAAVGPTVSLCDPRCARPSPLADAGAPVTSLAWHPDGSILAAATAGGSVCWLDARGGRRALTLAAPHGPAAPPALAWSADGARLVTGGGDRRVTVWEVPSSPAPATPAPRLTPPPLPHPAPPPPASLDALEGAVGRLADALASLDARAEAVARRVGGRAARCLAVR